MDDGFIFTRKHWSVGSRSIDQAFHRTKLQRSARNLENIVIPLVITQTMDKLIKLRKKALCKLCKQYLQPITNFTTANGNTWNIKSQITCNSKNAIYLLSCKVCNGNTNYIGQTTILDKEWAIIYRIAYTLSNWSLLRTDYLDTHMAYRIKITMIRLTCQSA